MKYILLIRDEFGNETTVQNDLQKWLVENRLRLISLRKSLQGALAHAKEITKDISDW